MSASITESGTKLQRLAAGVRSATGDEVAISIHIYGTDVTRIGSSVRRYYDLAVA